MSSFRRSWLTPVFLACLTSTANAQTGGETISIVGKAAPAVASSASGTATLLDVSDITALPYDRLDDLLAAKSGFSLFRRIPSLTANPTIQGASLRGIGPNGAGRASVLLDGAPLNDPFGNWVSWASILPDTISAAALLPGSRPVAAGPGALSGLIAIETSEAAEGLRLRMSGNSLEGGDASVVYAGASGPLDIIAFAGGGLREGYIPIIASQRGPADVQAASHNFSGGIKVATDVSDTWRGGLLLRGFSEARDNGLDGAENDTQGFDGSLRLVKTTEQLTVDASAYGQVRRFASLFTATDAARETTRPVLDQFSVPSYAFGSRINVANRWSDKHQSNLFLQADWRRGETNERFRNLGAGFTRLRTAGGRQSNFGIGVHHESALSAKLTVDGGIRLDVLRLRGGQRLEENLETGGLVRDDAFENRSDTILGGSAGVRYQPAPAWVLKARGYTGSRQPSLNEYFRPFRVGNDITEANPDLDIETLRGFDVSARYEPITGQYIALTLFQNWLRDAVGNLTVAGTPGGFIAPCGFVPGNGSCRQRGNIDRAKVKGAELSAGAAIAQTFNLSVTYAFSDAEISRSAANPALEGKRFAQVPRHQGSLDLRWQTPVDGLTTSAVVRAQSRQFEDDLNARALDSFAAVDVRLRWQTSDAVSFHLDAINLTDTRIEAGQTADGLITRGQPLTITVGLIGQF
ncbi:MAG: TonB-dependent receptor [Pseudomonadota bacterium]